MASICESFFKTENLNARATHFNGEATSKED